MKNFSYLALALLLVSASFAVDDWSNTKKPAQVTVEEVPPVSITAAKPATVEIKFRVRDGLHINSNKPSSELLIPTTLKINAVPQVTVGKTSFPAGHDFTLPVDPTEKLNVYSGEVTLTTQIAAAKPLAPGNYTLKAELHYQACDDSSCYPPKTASFDVPVKVVVAVRK